MPTIGDIPGRGVYDDNGDCKVGGIGMAVPDIPITRLWMETWLQWDFRERGEAYSTVERVHLR